jgi:hypothetical protein
MPQGFHHLPLQSRLANLGNREIDLEPGRPLAGDCPPGGRRDQKRRWKDDLRRQRAKGDPTIPMGQSKGSPALYFPIQAWP